LGETVPFLRSIKFLMSSSNELRNVTFPVKGKRPLPIFPLQYLLLCPSVVH